MKTIFTVLVLVMASSSVFAAQTKQQVIEQAARKFDLKLQKKAKRDAVKARYSGQIEKLRDAQRTEMSNL